MAESLALIFEHYKDANHETATNISHQEFLSPWLFCITHSRRCVCGMTPIATTRAFCSFFICIFEGLLEELHNCLVEAPLAFTSLDTLDISQQEVVWHA